MTGEKAAAESDSGETAVERVYEQAKAMAISFEFLPGTRVNELAVARQIGVSRTPLREALNRLTAEGFLTFSRKQGFFRKPLSVRAVADLYDWREQIERGVIRLAVERARDAALDDMEAFVAAAAPAEASSQDRLALDERFHERLAAMTGNVEIVEAQKNLNERIRFVRLIDVETRGAPTPAQYRAILDVLRRRDGAAAEALIVAKVALPDDQVVAIVKDAFARIYMGGDGGFIPPV